MAQVKRADKYRWSGAGKLLAVFGDDGFGDVAWYVGVMVEFHARAGATLAHAAKVGGVAEHFTQGDEAIDFLNPWAEVFHSFNAATFAV